MLLILYVINMECKDVIGRGIVIVFFEEFKRRGVLVFKVMSIGFDGVFVMIGK